MALMGYVVNEKSAIGVARSQRMTPSFGNVSAYESGGPAKCCHPEADAWRRKRRKRGTLCFNDGLHWSASSPRAKVAHPALNPGSVPSPSQQRVEGGSS